MSTVRRQPATSVEVYPPPDQSLPEGVRQLNAISDEISGYIRATEAIYDALRVPCSASVPIDFKNPLDGPALAYGDLNGTNCLHITYPSTTAIEPVKLVAASRRLRIQAAGRFRDLHEALRVEVWALVDQGRINTIQLVEFIADLKRDGGA